MSVETIQQLLRPLQVQVLISGAGTNALNIADQLHGPLKGLVQIQQIISNNPAAPGLAAAQQKGIATCCVNHREFSSKSDFEYALRQQIQSKPCDLLVLAGFMRVLSAEFVQHFAGKIINIHPSLLPDYRGLNTHERVLADGGTRHGVSVHLVIADLDAGPVLGQACLSVTGQDTAVSLRERVQQLEYWLYPECIRLIASGQIQLHTASLSFDPTLPLNAEGFLIWNEQQILDAK